MTDPQTVDWGALYESMRRDGGAAVALDDAGVDRNRDRARALWVSCNEVLQNLQSYHPVGFGRLPPALAKVSVAEILSNSARADAEHNYDAKNVVRSFAAWRTHVTETEATNASRLFMLAQTLRTLADLHGRATQPELVLVRIADLGRFIEDAWGVAIPLSKGDIRGWSARVTRRYDLLSAEWREL